MRAAAFALLIGAAIAGGVTEEATPAPHDDAAATSDVVEPAMPTHHGHSDEQLDGFGNPMSWEHDPPHGGHGHHDHGGHGRGHGNMHHGKGCFLFPVLLLIFCVTTLYITLRFVAPRQKFTSPIHHCFKDWGSCCLTSWCPCVSFGLNAEYALDIPWWAMCCTYWCCHNCACCLGLWSRGNARRKLGIEGTCVEDGCIHAFAHPCALCQESREIAAARTGERPIPAVEASLATTFAVACPEGCVPGEQVTLQTPAGLVALVIPAGVAPGQTFQVEIGAPVAAVEGTPVQQKMEGMEMDELAKPLMV